MQLGDMRNVNKNMIHGISTYSGLNQLWLSALWGVALCVSAGLGGVGCTTYSQQHRPFSVFHLSLASPPPGQPTASMSAGFFGFDAALPEHRQSQHRPNDGAVTSKFQSASSVPNPFNLEAPEDEEMEVYTWGQGMEKDTEEADELNDATFGVDINAISEQCGFLRS